MEAAEEEEIPDTRTGVETEEEEERDMESIKRSVLLLCQKYSQTTIPRTIAQALVDKPNESLS